MRNPQNDALALAESEPHVPERTCILTRRKGSKDELIRLAALATLDPGDRAVFPWPSFQSYPTAAASAAYCALSMTPDVVEKSQTCASDPAMT